MTAHPAVAASDDRRAGRGLAAVGRAENPICDSRSNLNAAAGVPRMKGRAEAGYAASGPLHPPLHGPRRWEGFHHSWAAFIAQQLNQDVLPPGYYAESEISLGPELEIDVATMEGPAVARPGLIATAACGAAAAQAGGESRFRPPGQL